MKYLLFPYISMLILFSSCKEEEVMDIDYLDLSQQSIDAAKHNVLGQWFTVTLDKSDLSYFPVNINERRINLTSEQYDVEQWSKDSEGLLAVVTLSDYATTNVKDTITFRYIRNNYLFYSFNSDQNSLFFFSKTKSMNDFLNPFK